MSTVGVIADDTLCPEGQATRLFLEFDFSLIEVDVTLVKGGVAFEITKALDFTVGIGVDIKDEGITAIDTEGLIPRPIWVGRSIKVGIGGMSDAVCILIDGLNSQLIFTENGASADAVF